jgi:hypothetical protein
MVPKTLVQVRLPGKITLAEVRYCLKTDSGYYVGLKQVPDFPAD